VILRPALLDWGLGFLLIGLLLAIPVRQGWTHVETDFPNYYTAAVAAREGLPLEKYYDWSWFQREMNFTGTERQLGAYVPQSPLALLPFLPLAGLPPQQAKQVWLGVNLILLPITIFLLARITGLPYRWLFAILLASFGSLSANFVLGQYYVFLCFCLL
jgi:Glycosyltransferase family 87